MAGLFPLLTFLPSSSCRSRLSPNAELPFRQEFDASPVGLQAMIGEMRYYVLRESVVPKNDRPDIGCAVDTQDLKIPGLKEIVGEDGKSNSIIMFIR
jgi:hypothetical protein